MSEQDSRGNCPGIQVWAAFSNGPDAGAAVEPAGEPPSTLQVTPGRPLWPALPDIEKETTHVNTLIPAWCCRWRWCCRWSPGRRSGFSLRRRRPSRRRLPTPGSQPAIVPPGQTATSSTGAPAKQPARPPARGTETMNFKTADELLTRARDRPTRRCITLTAELVYDRPFALQGDRQVRKANCSSCRMPTIEQVMPPRRDRKCRDPVRRAYCRLAR